MTLQNIQWCFYPLKTKIINSTKSKCFHVSLRFLFCNNPLNHLKYYVIMTTWCNQMWYLGIWKKYVSKDIASSFYVLKPICTAVSLHRTTLRGCVSLVCCLTHGMTEVQTNVPQDAGICTFVRSAPTVILFSRHDFLTLEIHKYVWYTLTSDLARIPCFRSHG